MQLPFRSSTADFCICIAVIHHLATEQRRIHAIGEIVRILRPGGQALIYVWAKNQQQDEKLSTYLKQNKNNSSEIVTSNDNTYSIKFNSSISQNGVAESEEKSANVEEISLPVHVNRTQFKYEDMLVPWKLKPKGKECTKDVPTFLRFYHVFSEGELETLCEKIPANRILKSYYDQGNWCVILEKL